MLSNIKRILGLSLTEIDTEDDAVLEQFIEMYFNALCIEVDEITVPTSLQFIVTEAVISRFNRRGSEGLKNESVDVVSQTFETDLFAPYKQLIQSYKANKQKATGTNRIRFL